MKSNFVSQLKTGQQLVDEPFMLQDLIQGTTNRGNPFLRMVLVDKSGQINSVYWDVPDSTMKWVKAGQVVFVEGKVGLYRDNPQVVVSSVTLHESPNMEDFMRTAGRSPDDMVDELRQHIASLSEPYQTLTAHILLNDDFLPQYAVAPAAKRMHHGYMGGLLAHVLSMVRVGIFLCEHYGNKINRDLLVTGVLLHDMGKVMEYDLSAGIDITDDGHLVGHIVRGIVMVEQAAAELGNIPADILRQIIHLIASHHGKLEWGSPVTPRTYEAIVLHQLDLLDSRVQGFLDFLSEDAGSSPWTQKVSPMFQTYLRHPEE